MPPTPFVFLEIDDNTPADLPAFTHDVSVWSFAGDLNLRTRTAAEAFRSLHVAQGRSEFRGHPPRMADGTIAALRNLADPSEVTWLSGAEVLAGRNCLRTGDGEVERTLRMLFDTVEVVARHFGADRVRLVFAFV